MIRRILALGGISIGFALAQTPANSNYTPPKTAWGEPDLQGTWPLNHLIAVPLQRNAQYGDRLYLTEDEMARAKSQLDQRNSRFESAPIQVADTSTRVMKQTSLIVDPPNGRFPELTELGKKIQEEMRSSYKPGQTVFDNVEDFAAWDRCITRGLPVSMLPRNYNNGIRIMQSPGYVAIFLEMAHEVRIIPTNNPAPLESDVKQYMGESRGHWEGNTLVVETKNFNGLVGLTSAGVPGSPGPLQPGTQNLRIIERFTRVGPEEIEFKMTVEDPTVLATGSFTVQYPMYLDNKYEMYEYACHEGNTAVRNYIEASRFERGLRPGK